MERGVQRWIVDISNWSPSPQQFSSALYLLPQHNQPSITRFIKMEDRKRALVSRFLQFSLVHEVLNIPFDQIQINRTLEGKPYLECDGRLGLEFPNFNFNVSHHGDFVAIASEPLCLVGLDIVHCVAPQKESVLEFIQNFYSYFTHLEWDRIVNAGGEDDVLTEFYRYWCLKEAYVKAIGSGVGYGLEKVEFHHTNWENISVKVDGLPVTSWRFWLLEIGRKHLVSIARAHPKFATESYKRRLRRTDFGDKEYKEGLLLPNPSFVWCDFEHILRYVNENCKVMNGLPIT